MLAAVTTAAVLAACGGGPAASPEDGTVREQPASTDQPESSEPAGAMSESEASTLEEELNSTDLAIEISQPAGGSEPIELVIVNRGPNPADAVEIQVTPATDVSVRDTDGEIAAACRTSDSMTVCDLGSLFARERRFLTFAFEAGEAARPGTTVTVIGIGANDTDSSNDSVTLK